MSHLAVEGSTSTDSVLVPGGLINVKWAVDGVSIIVRLRRLYPHLFSQRSPYIRALSAPLKVQSPEASGYVKERY